MHSIKSFFHLPTRQDPESDSPGGDLKILPDPRPHTDSTAGLGKEPIKSKPLPPTPPVPTRPPRKEALRVPRSRDPTPNPNPRPEPKPRPPVPKETAYVPKRPIIAGNWNEEKGRPYRPGDLRPKMDPLHSWNVEGEHRRARVRSIEMGPKIDPNWRSLIRPTRN